MIDTLEFVLNRYNVVKDSKPISLPYKRGELGLLFKALDFKLGAEIGTDRGFFAEELSQLNPEGKLICIDPWKVYSAYHDFTDQHKLDKNYEETKRRLAPYNCEIIKKSSEGAIKDFKENSLDYVYIDGNHEFEYVLWDIQHWSKIIKPGGIISGHDYTWMAHRRPRYDVQRALKIYFEGQTPTLFLLTAQRSSSWFFVKV